MANNWIMQGDYLKTCSCAPGCPCDFWAPPTLHLCEGVISLRIDKGHFDAINLDGLAWAVAFHWPGPLHLGNGTIQPYVDRKASDAQRNALLTIMSGKAGGPWFEVVASLVSTVLAPRFVDIQFEFDMPRRRGRIAIPGELEAAVEPILDVGGNIVEADIHLPKGIEYFTAEVALAKVLKSSGPVKFDRKSVHGSFSSVCHTPAGLRA